MLEQQLRCISFCCFRSKLLGKSTERQTESCDISFPWWHIRETDVHNGVTHKLKRVWDFISLSPGEVCRGGSYKKRFSLLPPDKLFQDERWAIVCGKRDECWWLEIEREEKGTKSETRCYPLSPTVCTWVCGARKYWEFIQAEIRKLSGFGAKG